MYTQTKAAAKLYTELKKKRNVKGKARADDPGMEGADGAEEAFKEVQFLDEIIGMSLTLSDSADTQPKLRKGRRRSWLLCPPRRGPRLTTRSARLTPTRRARASSASAALILRLL
jgi:hypothetical protein